MNRALSLLLVAAIGQASTTTSWEMNTFADFLRGRFSGVSLSRDGRIAMAPKLAPVFSPGQPSIWSVAEGADKTLYLGTGHRGRLYRVGADGKSSLLWTAPEPEIFAVAAGPDGAVYAGTSPDGKVYRIHGGQATEYFSPGARYIWSLVFGRDGSLYAGTGDQGKVFRITAAGQGELYYDSGQAHITALALDSEARLLAGSEPNGILYRISAKEKAFVLHDANLPEIRAIVPMPDGTVYAAALGGSVAQKTAPSPSGTTPGTSPATAPITSITVTDDAQAGVEIKPKTPDPAKAAPPAVVPPAYSAPIEMVGVEKSALYRINPDHTVDTLWSSKDENIYDIYVSESMIVFGTDGQGRIYRLNPDRRATLLLQTNEGEATRIMVNGDSLVAATGTMGKLFRIGPGLAPEGYYESPVHDASTVARWGQLSWRGERTGNGKLAFRTRSGNSARPDKTWSEWSEPITDQRGAGIASPNARFVQWKAELTPGEGASPSITGVTLSYLPQNNAPEVKSLNVTTVLAPATGGSTKPATAQAPSSTYSVTVTDSGDASASTLSGTPTQLMSRGVSQQIQLNWQVEDVDGDKLIYALYFRGEDEAQWKSLRTNFTETSLTLEGDVFADGKYLFRVVASDKQSNSTRTAREAELTSSPVLFDNTPPSLTASTPRRIGSRVEIDVEATDVASSLRRAEYSLDATAWLPVESADGVTDGARESFRIVLDNVSAGEHVVAIRAYDSSNNAGVTKVVVR